jgi:3-dehydroquinate synthase
MPDGEESKSLATVEDLARLMARHGADRGSVVVAFGGGVAGDVAGFLASVYMRGVDCVQVPTTLLAQVDAAIGGKTGVNLPAGKNLVGTFHQPRAVFVDPAVLRTLPEREYRAGLYEALKCGVIRNPKIFAFLEEERRRILRRDPRALAWLITECVRVKAAVVAADERERGLRRILNFGHTIGHALEAETGFRLFLHGEGVAWGMIAATLIAERLGRIRSADAQRIIAAMLALGPLPAIEAGAAGVQRRIATDKKTRDGVAHFVLPLSIGKVEVVPDVPLRVVRAAIERVRELSRSSR